ncbi:MAG: arabinose-5-phosphate isomerase [Pseudohongiellaceae bacterium]|jgi:arabinose-5-phosphate isomerase
MTPTPSPSSQQKISDTSDDTFVKVGRRTIALEIAAIEALTARINQDFVKACHIILECKGRTIVTGMGKSGHIGKKIAATLASTGSPSFFVHPGEASHGDLGMITTSDVVIAISNSGSSAEVMALLPTIKRIGIPLISMTGQHNSPLAQQADTNLDVSVEIEACPLDLAPTSSTTVTLVMGDALAVALLEARGFTPEDFAFSHPGGALGRRLVLTVGDIMHGGIDLPAVQENTSLPQTLIEMTQKGLGITTVINKDNKLTGVFTDGDLRRAIDKNIDINRALIKDVMSPNPSTIMPTILVTEAVSIMEQRSITALIVANELQQPIGVIHMHDILRAGIL